MPPASRLQRSSTVTRRLDVDDAAEPPVSALARYRAYFSADVPALRHPAASARSKTSGTQQQQQEAFGRSATTGHPASARSSARSSAAASSGSATASRTHTFTVAVRLQPPDFHRQEQNLLAIQPAERRSGSAATPAFAIRYAKNRKEHIVDHVFSDAVPSTNTQLYVFETLISPLIRSIVSGANCCVLAYGATGTGKTHTMFGTSTDPGIARRLTHALCEQMSIPDTEVEGEGAASDVDVIPSTETSPGRARGLSVAGAVSNSSFRTSGRVSYTIPDCVPGLELSFVELYCDRIVDLFADERTPDLKLKEVDGTFVLRSDATEGSSSETRLRVKSRDGAVRAILAGLRRRTEGQSHANQRSSRGHAVLTFHVNIPGPESVGSARRSIVRLVDLAGSEKHSTNLPETGSINRSLLALGQVMQGLARANADHIPFRDSTLTSLLKSALFSPHSRCVMIATLDPTDSMNTKHTLQHAVVATRIAVDGSDLVPKKRSNIEAIAELEDENRRLQDEVEHLEAERQRLRALFEEACASPPLHHPSVAPRSEEMEWSPSGTPPDRSPHPNVPMSLVSVQHPHAETVPVGMISEGDAYSPSASPTPLATQSPTEVVHDAGSEPLWRPSDETESSRLRTTRASLSSDSGCRKNATSTPSAEALEGPLPPAGEPSIRTRTIAVQAGCSSPACSVAREVQAVLLGGVLSGSDASVGVNLSAPTSSCGCHACPVVASRATSPLMPLDDHGCDAVCEAVVPLSVAHCQTDEIAASRASHSTQVDLRDVRDAACETGHELSAPQCSVATMAGCPTRDKAVATTLLSVAHVGVQIDIMPKAAAASFSNAAERFVRAVTFAILVLVCLWIVEGHSGTAPSHDSASPLATNKALNGAVAHQTYVDVMSAWLPLCDARSEGVSQPLNTTQNDVPRHGVEEAQVRSPETIVTVVYGPVLAQCGAADALLAVENGTCSLRRQSQPARSAKPVQKHAGSIVVRARGEVHFMRWLRATWTLLLSPLTFLQQLAS